MDRFFRLAVAWIALLACTAQLGGCAGDDTDPDSDACKKIRADYLKVQLQRDYAAKHGVDTTYLDTLQAEYVNKHWGCFH